MPRVIPVIESTVHRGKGIEGDPSRLVKQYHTLDGELLAEYDAWKEQHESEEKSKDVEEFEL